MSPAQEGELAAPWEWGQAGVWIFWDTSVAFMARRGAEQACSELGLSSQMSPVAPPLFMVHVGSQFSFSSAAEGRWEQSHLCGYLSLIPQPGNSYNPRSLNIPVNRAALAEGNSSQSEP